MERVLDALAAQHAQLGALLDGLDDAGWTAPVPRCPGWDVADVVLHLAQTDEMAAASAGGRFADFVAAITAGLAPAADVDEAVAAMVAKERSASSPAEIHARWQRASAAERSALAAADPHARVDWAAGPMSVRTLATTRLSETWIHTGDVAGAVGLTPAPPPGDGLVEIARLAWRTLGYAFARSGRTLAGPVAFDLTGPDGSRWRFEPEGAAATTISGPAHELCLVAARRLDPAATSLHGEGPDAAAVLELVRTYA